MAILQFVYARISLLSYIRTMPTIAKTATLDALGLPVGDHLVHFHVGADVVSFEIASGSTPETELSAPRTPSGFLKPWGGTVRKIEDSADAWLPHINEKHVR